MPTTTDEAVLVALNEEFQNAVRTGDVAALERILSDDFVLYTGGSGDAAIAKTGVIADTERTRYVMNASSDVRARVWGDTGVVTARLTMKGTRDGKPFDVAVRFTDTYVRDGTGWKQVSAHASRAPANEM